MGRGSLVLYLDTKENAEVAAGAGIPFEHGELAVLCAATSLAVLDAAFDVDRRDWMTGLMVVAIIVDDSLFISSQILTRAVCFSRGPDTSGAKAPQFLVTHRHG